MGGSEWRGAVLGELEWRDGEIAELEEISRIEECEFRVRLSAVGCGFEGTCSFVCNKQSEGLKILMKLIV